LKKSLTGRANPLRQPREHGDLIWILLHGVRISCGGAPHVDFLLSKKSTVQQRKQILSLGWDLGTAETPAAMTLLRIRRVPLGISSSRRQSSSSWTTRASFSKCTRFSLAFARGLRRWLSAALRLDLQSPLRWQCALAVDSRHDLLRMAASAWGAKP
jgi:hypothetical protein